MKKSLYIVAAASALFAGGVFASTTYYVDGRPGRGSDDWDGLTPDTAKATIHEAVKMATEAGDTVSVAPATYAVTCPITNVSVGTSVKSLKLIAQSSNPRDTVIDGGGTTMCIYLCASGNTIAGFTVTNGYADANSGFGVVGGAGIRLSYGSVVSNCVVTGCRSVGSGQQVCGGGVYSEGGAVVFTYDGLTVENCSILSTSGKQWLRGGGLFHQGPGHMRRSVVRNCTLKMDGGASGGESAIGGGAAIQASTAGGLRVSGCRFVDNLITNTASGDFGDGGGVYMTCADVEQTAKLIIGMEDSLVANNRCGYYGAGLYLNGVAVSGLTVSNNTSLAVNNPSAGIYAKKSTCATADIYSSVSSSLIVGNTAKNGGAGLYLSGVATVSNCFFRGNSRQAIYLNAQTEAGSLVTNCRFEKNPGGELNGKTMGLTVTDCTFDDAGLTRCSSMISVGNPKNGSGGSEFLTVRNCRFANFNGSSCIGLGAPVETAPCSYDACTFANVTNTGSQTFSLAAAANAEYATLKNLLFAGTAATSTKTVFANPDIPAAFDDYTENVVSTQSVTLARLRDFSKGDFRLKSRCGARDAGTVSAWMNDALDMGTGTFDVCPLGTWGVDLAKVEPRPRVWGARPDIGCCEYVPRAGLTVLIR